jgi:hypothetical protein
MVVGDRELDPMQSALLELQQEIAPARAALPIGELDTQDAAPAVPADRHRNQHRLAADHPGLAHPLITRIEDQVRVGLLEPALGKLRQAGIQPLVDGADARGRKAVPTQFLRDRLHLSRGYPLDIHLRQGRNESPLGALIALEQLRRESTFPVLRHPQLQFADPRHQRPAIVSRTIAEPLSCSFALGRTDRLGHLGLENLLQRRAHQNPDKVRV